MTLTDTEREYLRGLLRAKIGELDSLAGSVTLDPVGQVVRLNALRAVPIMRAVLSKLDAEPPSMIHTWYDEQPPHSMGGCPLCPPK